MSVALATGSMPSRVTPRDSRSLVITAGTLTRLDQATKPAFAKRRSSSSSSSGMQVAYARIVEVVGVVHLNVPGQGANAVEIIWSTMPRVSAVMKIMAHAPTAMAPSMTIVRR